MPSFYRGSCGLFRTGLTVGRDEIIRISDPQKIWLGHCL
jgi:hypothetical protein